MISVEDFSNPENEEIEVQKRDHVVVWGSSIVELDVGKERDWTEIVRLFRLFALSVGDVNHDSSNTNYFLWLVSLTGNRLVMGANGKYYGVELLNPYYNVSNFGPVPSEITYPSFSEVFNWVDRDSPAVSTRIRLFLFLTPTCWEGPRNFTCPSVRL